MKVRLVPIDYPVLDEKNPRLHGERNLRAIRDSLAKFGQAEPIVLQKGSRRVIAGNGRLSVMRDLGWAHCRIVELDIDDAKARLLAIAMNRTGDLSADNWDRDALAVILETLSDAERSELAFEPLEVEALLAPSTAPASFPDAEKASLSTGIDHQCPRCGYGWSGVALQEAPPKEEDEESH